LISVYAFTQINYSGALARSLLNYFLYEYIFIFAFYFLQDLFKVSILNQELEIAASTDYLTNLPNRRKVDQELNSHFQNKCNSDVSIILFDIDHFKTINDKYGHDVGDYVLKEISYLLQKSKDKHSIVGRWGGEEFILIVKEQIDALDEAERIRTLIQSHSFQHVSSITASFGVAVYEPGDDKDSLLIRTDNALYSAKENGRNQVQIKWVKGKWRKRLDRFIENKLPLSLT
jgi:diguanylate cyclase (GGDEF)-like protein